MPNTSYSYYLHCNELHSRIAADARDNILPVLHCLIVYFCFAFDLILQADIKSPLQQCDILLSSVCQRSVWWSVCSGAERGDVDHITLSGVS